MICPKHSNASCQGRNRVLEMLFPQIQAGLCSAQDIFFAGWIIIFFTPVPGRFHCPQGFRFLTRNRLFSSCRLTHFSEVTIQLLPFFPFNSFVDCLADSVPAGFSSPQSRTRPLSSPECDAKLTPLHIPETGWTFHNSAPPPPPHHFTMCGPDGAAVGEVLQTRHSLYLRAFFVSLEVRALRRSPQLLHCCCSSGRWPLGLFETTPVFAQKAFAFFLTLTRFFCSCRIAHFSVVIVQLFPFFPFQFLCGTKRASPHQPAAVPTAQTVYALCL